MKGFAWGCVALWFIFLFFLGVLSDLCGGLLELLSHSLQTPRRKDTIELMPDDKNSNPKKEWVKAEGYLQLGITMPAAVFVGWVLGALLDRWLHTHWITFAGLMLGIVTGFYLLIRVAIAAGKEE